jgi:hypothetical protein
MYLIQYFLKAEYSEIDTYGYGIVEIKFTLATINIIYH